MGCVCCSISSFISILLDALERISLCTVCAMLTCCFLLTILTVLVMGIGIGYHYCFVQTSVEAVEKAAKTQSALRTGDKPERSQMLRSVDKAMKRSFARRLARRDTNDTSALFNNNTLNSMYSHNYNYTLLNDSLFNSTELFTIINSTLGNSTNYTVTLA